MMALQLEKLSEGHFLAVILRIVLLYKITLAAEVQ